MKKNTKADAKPRLSDLNVEHRSVAFCEWIEATFACLDSCDAATITFKAQETFLGATLVGDSAMQGKRTA